MKYVFLVLLSWFVGFHLPELSSALQFVGAGLAVLNVACGVYYYIDTRVNTIRIK